MTRQLTAAALLEGKTSASAESGKSGVSQTILRDVGVLFPFDCRTNAGVETWQARDGRVLTLLKKHPDRKILHTVQVERNDFIQVMLIGSPFAGQDDDYLSARTYGNCIWPE